MGENQTTEANSKEISPVREKRIRSMGIKSLTGLLVLVMALGVIVRQIGNRQMVTSRAEEIEETEAAAAIAAAAGDKSGDGTPLISYFKTDSYTIANQYGSLAPVQLYSGGMILSEFSDEEQVYPDGHANEYFPIPMAGHVGQFEALPYFSKLSSSDEGEFFGTGLVIKNTPGQKGYENQINLETSTSTWYPSKIVVENFYTNTETGKLKDLKIRSAKIALPGNRNGKTIRGFAVKMGVTNTATSASQTDLMWLTVVPNLWIKEQAPASFPKKTITVSVTPDAAAGRPYTVINQDGKVFLLVGVKLPTGATLTWKTSGVSTRATELVSPFNSAADSKFANVSKAATADGQALGYAIKLPSSAAGRTQTLTYFAFVGASLAEVEDQWKYYQQSVGDVETDTDGYWNTRLSQLFSGLPIVESSSAMTEKLYYNSALAYYQVLNELFGKKQITQSGLRGGWGNELYTWMMGTDMFWAMADKTAWKSQLLDMLGVDYENCRTRAIFGNGACEVPYRSGYPNSYPYAYSTLSLTRQIWEYVRLYEDMAFLKQTVKNKGTTYRVIDLLEKWTNQLDASASGQILTVGSATSPTASLVNSGTTKMTDFTTYIKEDRAPENRAWDIQEDSHYYSDSSLFETNWRLYNPKINFGKCQIFGNSNWRGYWGKVPVPNANRYMSHTILADLYSWMGEKTKGDSHRTWAANVKNTVMSKMWIDSAGWFREREGSNNIFYFEPMLEVLDFPGFLNETQKAKMIANVPKLVGPWGFYTTPGGNNGGVSNEKCTRTDWQGPGLYSGAAGLLLQNLFQFGDKNTTFDYLKKYERFAQNPVGTQSYPANQVKFPAKPKPKYGELGSSWYDEHTALAQVYLRGFLGLEPVVTSQTGYVKLRPRVPDELGRDGQFLKISRATAQDSRWSLNAVDGQYHITIEPISGGNGREVYEFWLDGDWPGSVTMTGMRSGSYAIRYGSSVGPVAVTVAAVNGVIRFDVQNGNRMIYVRPSQIMPWTGGGPNSGWTDKTLGKVYTCNWEWCWVYNDATSTWDNGGKPINLTVDSKWKSLVANDTGGTVFPWSDGGPTAGWGNPYRQWHSACSGKWCFTYEEKTARWRAPNDISHPTTGWKVKALDGILPWTDGGPTAGWVNTTKNFVYHCNGKYCWQFNDATSVWLNNGLPFDISKSAPWNTTAAAADGTRLWSGKGITAGWSNPVKKLHTVCNTKWCWSYKEATGTWSAAYDLSTHPAWTVVKPGQ